MNIHYDIHDRRCLYRNQCQYTAQLVFHDGKKNQYSCLIKNFSLKGALLELPIAIDTSVGDLAQLYFHGQKISLQGKIIWISNLSTCSNIGIEFSRIAKEYILNNPIFFRTPDRRKYPNKHDPLHQIRRTVDSKNRSIAEKTIFTPSYSRQCDRRITSRNEFLIPRRLQERRAATITSNISPNFIYQSIKSILTVVRDLFIPILPKMITKLIVGKTDFVFIAHPRDFRDVKRMFPFAKFISHSIVKNWFRFQWPFIASNIIFSPKGSKPILGKFIISPLWTKHMMKDNDLARKKIISAAKFAEKIGARVVGLGAFTSIVTHDGLDVIDHVNCGVTTGNPLSASVAVENLLHAFRVLNLTSSILKVAIVGAGGSVGSGCAELLIGHVEELHLVDINPKSLNILLQKLKDRIVMEGFKTKISYSHNSDLVHNFHGVIVVTNAIGTVITEKHLKKGAVVIDCAQPKNVSSNVPLARKDVLVIESAIISADDLRVEFDLDLREKEALGCLAESIILASLPYKRHLILGKVSNKQAKDIFYEAVNLGFKIAYFRNAKGLVDEECIKNVQVAIRESKLELQNRI